MAISQIDSLVPDDADSAAMRIALFVALSQPFYPLTIWMASGWPAARAAMSVWLVTGLFLLVPKLARAVPGGGRLLLLAAGTLVTLTALVTLGTGSLADAYLVPVLVSGVLLFRRDRWLVRLVALIVPIGCLLAVRHFASPDGLLPDLSQASACRMVHLLGAAGLTAYIGWQARTV